MGSFLKYQAPEYIYNLLQLPDLAIKAKAVIPMNGEKVARGRDLFKKIRVVENCNIHIRNGIIVDIGKQSEVKLPDNIPLLEIDDFCLIPPVINCHTHLQLSWLENKTLWGNGFTLWLKSMVPQILLMKEFSANDSLLKNVRSLRKTGTLYAGDITGSIPGALSSTRRAFQEYGLNAISFCEWFGWSRNYCLPWPERCRNEIKNDPSCAPAGHALYSTDPEILQAVHHRCRQMGKVFTFHLAESWEENDLLINGSGPLSKYYEDMVLPSGWKPPGMRPFAYAASLGLIGKNTLAVHGVTLGEDEIDQLAQSAAFLCLCPRSNHNLAVGSANIIYMLEKGVLLCLGTDGLSSCEDVDVHNEAYYMHENFDIPWEVLIRLLTINGLHALGIKRERSGLFAGSPARFGLLPIDIIRDCEISSS